MGSSLRPAVLSSYFGSQVNRPAFEWYKDNRFLHTSYSSPLQVFGDLHSPKPQEWLLGRDGRLNPAVFRQDVKKNKAAGEMQVKLATWNTMDITAACLNYVPGVDNSNERAGKLAGIVKRIGLKALFTQESNVPMVRSFVEAGYKVVGEYADAEGGVQNKWNVAGWTAFPGHNSRWQDTPLRAAERSNRGVVSGVLAAIGNAKLWWTGLSFYYDPKRYTMDDNCGSWFKAYSDSSQSSWTATFAYLSKVVVNAVTRDTGALQRNWLAAKNSLSGISRFDGVLIVKIYNNKYARYEYFVQTHLESFDNDKRALQMQQFLDEIHALAINNPDTFIYIGGDFNQPQSNEFGHGDLYGTLHQNPDFAQGRCVGVPRVDVRESFNGEGSLDGVYMIVPRGYELVNAAGQALLPGKQPPQGEDLEAADDTDIGDELVTDHCLVTGRFILRPKGG